MDLKKFLEEERSRLKVSWEVLEQDFVLSWVLFGIASTNELRENLVFKGGTALKKIYFGNYRFSQDLDFTGLSGAPMGEDLEKLLKKACETAQHELNTRIRNPILTCKRYTEKSPHPHGQDAFVILAQLPWHRVPYVRVMVEITRHQQVVNTPVLKSIIHSYPEDFSGEVLCYSLDEIFAEKLLAMLQNAKKLHERGWSRSRARDYYDLWKMLNMRQGELNAKTILETFTIKRGSLVSYASIDDFFDPVALSGVKRDWDEWLSPLLYPLPSYDEVVGELRKQLTDFLK